MASPAKSWDWWSYHFKYPIKNILCSQKSVDFAISIVIGNETKILEWTLTYGRRNEDKQHFIWLQLRDCGFLPPLICRMALKIPEHRPYVNRSKSINFSGDHLEKYGVYFFFQSDEAKRFVGDGLEIHCWMEIPRPLTQSDGRKENHAKSKSVEPENEKKRKIFQSVIGNDSEMASLCSVVLNIVQDQKTVRQFFCDTRILAAVSDVFKRMFLNDEWIEREKQGKREVEIKDIDEKTMEIILDYIYNNNFPESSSIDSLALIVYAADKYNLGKLLDWSGKALIRQPCNDVERVLLLQLADRHRLVWLKNVCVASLSTNMAIFQDSDFRRLLSDELWTDLINAVAKRQFDTLEITFSAKK